jgi:hypothetical protein
MQFFFFLAVTGHGRDALSLFTLLKARAVTTIKLNRLRSSQTAISALLQKVSPNLTVMVVTPNGFASFATSV